MAIVESGLSFAAVALQGAAGQTAVVAAAGAGVRIYVVGWMLSLDAAGTLKFQSANTDLTGAMSVGTAPVGQTGSNIPLFRTAANEALNITTATGKAAGYVVYYTGA